jgi:TusA-related sulfurtransferase
METRRLDVRGTKCPVPNVRAKKEIDAMRPGDVLEVLATDPGAVADFQGWAKTSKLAILKAQRTEKDETGREIYVQVLERRA